MQLHDLKPTHTNKTRKRVGRGGKRGTFSGHGSKGQKARAGARIRPGFRGGDNPLWKLFPKQRGATKKTDVKHRSFSRHQTKPIIINLGLLNTVFNEGDMIDAKILMERGYIRTTKPGVKVLGTGELTKKFNFTGIEFSTAAREKVLKCGGSIN